MPYEARQIIGDTDIQKRVFGQRSWCDEAHHIALHHRLGPTLFRFGRVFQLFTNRHPVAMADQLVQIVVNRMHWHAAHGNILAQMFAAFCQRNA